MAALSDLIQLPNSINANLPTYRSDSFFPSQDIDTVSASITNQTTNLQTWLNLIGALGGDAILSMGAIGVNAKVTIPANVKLKAEYRHLSKIWILSSFSSTTDPVFENQSPPSGQDVACPGIEISGIWFKSLRSFPDWLSKADGTPITDPKADYRAGGVLAPTTIPTANLTVTGGAVTAATITNVGSGLNYPVVAWVYGVGEGAQIEFNVAGGVLDGTYTIRDGGRGYVQASTTVEIGGGGANPATALFAADRRNPNWNRTAPLISLIKCQSPRIFENLFEDYYGNNIQDAGNDDLHVFRNEFKNGGQSDFVGNCIWSQSHGTPPSEGGTPASFFRYSTGTKFYLNKVKNWKRSVGLIGGINFSAFKNDIDGWGESCWYVQEWSKTSCRLEGNQAKNGIITDIICSYLEGDKGYVVGETVENIDGFFTSHFRTGAYVLQNKVIAGSTWTSVYPFGPYSERVGFNVGQRPIAGTQRSYIRYVVKCFDIDADPDNAPKMYVANDNTLIDPDGVFDRFLHFEKGAANSIENVFAERNNLINAPSTEMYNATNKSQCVSNSTTFLVQNNPGGV